MCLMTWPMFKFGDALILLHVGQAFTGVFDFVREVCSLWAMCDRGWLSLERLCKERSNPFLPGGLEVLEGATYSERVLASPILCFSALKVCSLCCASLFATCSDSLTGEIDVGCAWLSHVRKDRGAVVVD